MTTFELWEALERAQVLAWMRVWREGMECWTPIGEIPEFTWAIAGTPHPPSDPEALAERDTELPEAPPAAPPASEPPPQSGTRAIEPPAPWGRPGARERAGFVAPRGPIVTAARWVALGSAVALVAVVSALVATSDPEPPPPAETRGAAAQRSPEAPAPELAPPPHVSAPQATLLHDERGQRRQPRDGRRAYRR
jgi:hypothetical protein